MVSLDQNNKIFLIKLFSEENYSCLFTKTKCVRVCNLIRTIVCLDFAVLLIITVPMEGKTVINI